MGNAPYENLRVLRAFVVNTLLFLWLRLCRVVLSSVTSIFSLLAALLRRVRKEIVDKYPWVSINLVRAFDCERPETGLAAERCCSVGQRNKTMIRFDHVRNNRRNLVPQASLCEISAA